MLLALDATQSGIADTTLLRFESALQPELRAMERVRTTAYKDPRSSINLPDDTDLLSAVRKILPKYASFDVLVVIGIGGSNLGTLAVHEALTPISYEPHNRPKIIFAETVDPHTALIQRQCIEDCLAAGKRVVVNVISKSGTTLETVANAGYLLEPFAAHRIPLQDHVVVTTDDQSALWHYAKGAGYDCLTVPAAIGGRYSVYSPVGLFPLGLMGIDLDVLLQGARTMRDLCLTGGISENPAALGAAILAGHYAADIHIHDLFFFSTALEATGKWYRQLLAESIGKEHARTGEQANVGITPTVSIGSSDLHSMVQLYLAGPRDRYTTFLRLRQSRDINVPRSGAFARLSEFTAGASFSELYNALLDGTQHAYANDNRPFTTLTIQDLSAQSMGELLQFFMMQTMFLGALLNVNPFDQPAVARYKAETERILGQR